MENYQSKLSIETPNSYLDYLANPSFKGINILFLLFENNKDRTTHTGFYLPKVEIKNYSVIKFLHQPIKK